MKQFLFFLILMTMFSCSKKEEKLKETPDQIDIRNQALNCLRWIDRDLYFATSDPFNSSVNNQFHKEQIKTVIKELELNSNLGEDYFRIKEINPDLLDPIRSVNLPQSEYKSFILIWNDDKFERFIIDNLCDPSVKAINELACLANIPDRNAIVVTNPNFKRKFYMILRSSCFEAGSRCTNPSTGNPLGNGGVSSLIARQFGFLLGITPVCNANEDVSSIPLSRRNNIMCRFPSDEQWNENVGTEDEPSFIRREAFYTGVNSQLATITNNPNFYQDAEYSATCLKKPWIDRVIHPACPIANGPINNYEYQIFLRDVQDALDEVSANTLLGPNYFTFPKEADGETAKCVNEDNIDFSLEKIEGFADSKSYLMLWDDFKINRFIRENEISVPDMNGFSFINAAWKSKFKLFLRASCFEIIDGLPPDFCYGGDYGVVDSGTNPAGLYQALVARQLGFMFGITAKNCSDNSMDVMCSDIPNKEQWGEKYKKRFFNKLNNYLELIGNDPNFYKQRFNESVEKKDDEE